MKQDMQYPLVIFEKPETLRPFTWLNISKYAVARDEEQLNRYCKEFDNPILTYNKRIVREGIRATNDPEFHGVNVLHSVNLKTI